MNFEMFLYQYLDLIPILISFLGGLFAFFSPCTFPLIPVFISYISGVSMEDYQNINPKNRKIIMRNILFFILGFTIIFIIMSLIISYFGNIARNILTSKFLFKFLGVIIIIFGFHMTGIFKSNYLLKDRKLNINFESNKWYVALFIGMIFAVGWSPCTGPILGTVLSMAAISSSILKGTLYLFFYSLGLGIPFIFIGLFIDKLYKKLKIVNKYIEKIQIISGILMIVMGILLFFNKLSIFNSWF